MTEKIFNAHMAGQVPVYWGDPLLTEVWNPKRVLVMDDNLGIDAARAPNLTSIIATAALLEESLVYREAFFSEPVLSPSAEQWMEAWCDAAESVLRKAYVAYSARSQKGAVSDFATHYSICCAFVCTQNSQNSPISPRNVKTTGSN